MGHTIQHYDYPGNADTKKWNRSWRTMLPRDASKRGGHLSKIRWIDSEPCANEDEARIRIEHLDKGWYDCIAVKYYDAYNIPETEKIKALRAANTQAYCKVQRTCVCIPFYKCKSGIYRLQNCGSKIARKYLLKKFLPCLQCRFAPRNNAQPHCCS